MQEKGYLDGLLTVGADGVHGFSWFDGGLDHAIGGDLVFLGGNFLGVLGDDWIGEGNLAPAGHLAESAFAGDIGIGQARAADGMQVEFSFQIFQVQREIEDVRIIDAELVPFSAERGGLSSLG